MDDLLESYKIKYTMWAVLLPPPISVLGYANKTPYRIYIAKKSFEEHIDLIVTSKSKNTNYF